jgi:hypothetical protein
LHCRKQAAPKANLGSWAREVQEVQEVQDIQQAQEVQTMRNRIASVGNGATADGSAYNF